MKIMIKWSIQTLLGFIFLYSTALYAVDKLRWHTEKKQNKEYKYTIDASFPLFQGNNLSFQENNFNQLVKKLIRIEIEQFEKEGKAFAKNYNELKLYHPNLGSNLTISTELTNPDFLNKKFISLRFTLDSYLLGAAHPNLTHKVLNFDLRSGALIFLPSVFKPAVDYKVILENYLIPILAKKTDISQDEIKNNFLYFDNWNFTKNGLLFTFDEFPHVLGPQEVVVPYNVIREKS